MARRPYPPDRGGVPLPARPTARIPVAGDSHRPTEGLCSPGQGSNLPRLKLNYPSSRAPHLGDSSRRSLLLAGCALVVVGGIARRDSSAVQSGAPFAPSPDLQDASRRAALCTARDAVGVGLLGEYFSLAGCSGETLLTRVDGVVDFDGTFDWPTDRILALPRSVRWSGWVRAPLDGRYRFHLDGEAASVTVARQPMLETNASIELSAGRYYPLQATLERMPAPAVRIRLEWTAPHGARYVIPRALLQLPTRVELKRT